MIKVKFFLSLLKERDWLEEMAAKGFLLTNMTFGIIYHFEESAPCAKVYEIERFAITSHPTIAELTAKSRALDITSQFGWKEVTHDEDMNYYFVKNKAGDETDEFYDTEELRRERADRYYKHYSLEQPRILIYDILFVSILYIICLCTLKNALALHWSFIFLIVFELLCISGTISMGQKAFTELCMSRKEWEQHKKYSQKKRFRKVQQLRSFLQEKSEFGLVLKGYENGYYMFEESPQRYNYFIDTRRCLKKRMKEDGLKFADETKDLQSQSLKWYEMSIANAAQYGLKPVAVIDKHILIYTRPYSEKKIPWENGNENISFTSPGLKALLFVLICGAIGFVIGFLSALLTNFIY